MTETPTLCWHDLQDWGVEGRGWTDTLCPYDRLPGRAEKFVPQSVWNLSRTATGICAMFETDASAIHARWQLRSSQLGEPNFPVAGFSGLDLYGDDADTWQWVAAGHVIADQRPELCLASGLDGAYRKYLLYLPLRNPVDRVEIGLPAGVRFTPVPPRHQKPLVFYGTSIVHGAYSSHAGIVYPSILGRRLHRPVINLGFSGSARMEPAMAELLAELDAKAFVLDTLPNMDLTLVQERAETFIRMLCTARPGVPIVLIEDYPLTNSWVRPAQLQAHENKWREFRRIYESLRGQGFNHLTYVEGRNLLGADCEASIDTVHPSDLGFMRLADAIEPVLRKVIA